MLRGARYGRTVESAGGTVLHCTEAVGQTVLGQGAGAGHTVGAGHFTSGQRVRGQGGHSPASLVHELLSMMTGFCLGMLDFNTYLLKSGVGGHSVFNI
jgi:hypothetical protein